MGMYDTVYFSCPKCDTEMYTQSKAGDCTLSYYKGPEGVPPGIAYDIQRDQVWCEGCKDSYRVITDPIPPPVLIKCYVVKD